MLPWASHLRGFEPQFVSSVKWAASADHCILGLFGGLEIKLVQHLEESVHVLATWKTGVLFLISRECSLKAQIASQAEVGMVVTIFLWSP